MKRFSWTININKKILTYFWFILSKLWWQNKRGQAKKKLWVFLKMHSILWFVLIFYIQNHDLLEWCHYIQHKIDPWNTFCHISVYSSEIDVPLRHFDRRVGNSVHLSWFHTAQNVNLMHILVDVTVKKRKTDISHIS